MKHLDVSWGEFTYNLREMSFLDVIVTKIDGIFIFLDFKSKEMRVRQRSVALYFIDKLALRAGNEKDEDQADTVGCCSLRVEHITLHEEHDGTYNSIT